MRLTVTILLVLNVTAASGAPLTVSQGSQHNIVSIIQQKNPIINIERNVTTSDGRKTITEIVQIGPDPVPVQIRQNGSVNRLRSVQEGRNPYIDVRQDGRLNRVSARQTMIP